MQDNTDKVINSRPLFSAVLFFVSKTNLDPVKVFLCIKNMDQQECKKGVTQRT